MNTAVSFTVLLCLVAGGCSLRQNSAVKEVSLAEKPVAKSSATQPTLPPPPQGSEQIQGSGHLESPNDIIAGATERSSQIVTHPETMSPQTKLHIIPGKDRLFQNGRTQSELEQHRVRTGKSLTYPVANVGANGAPLLDSGLVSVPR